MSSTFLINHASPLTQIAYGEASITGSYTLAGTFTSPVVWMMFTSTLDAAVQISFDGVHDHIAIPAGSTTPVFIPINFKNNKIVFQRPSIYVKRIGTPSAGSLYVSAFTNV